MKNEVFSELLKSANQALEHSQGKRSLKTTTLPAPPEPMRAVQVRRVRTALNASQAVFAWYLNVSTSLVQAWESDTRTPKGPALVLLHIVATQPQAIEKVLLQEKDQSPRTGRPSAGPSHGRSPPD